MLHFGHNLTGNVIERPYFGSERVINDLKKWKSYPKGHVSITKDMILRDKHTGLVNKIDYNIKYLSIIRNMLCHIYKYLNNDNILYYKMNHICSICLHTINELCQTNCNHHFCKDCLDTWFNAKKKYCLMSFRY